ncbi:APC family permease [Poritiphilus flavus]|uniref:Amino acid permease n=1 Tax=Poritiphilus flavus TaxID=2697053 RepID=A0A6L9E7J7_9FLAO|nr:amino acid permease [Poritiphilus flavus]NAS10614.1 amino acid permease [Poritiphilus flavus]
MSEAKLKRSISLPVLFLYGLGTMVGGGFYALSGKVAGMAGMAAPLSFLLAGLLAFLNVFTFAELSSRYPASAGEAKYVYKAFGSSLFSGLIGWMVILTGVVSAATLSVATITFFQELVIVPEALGLIVLVVLMGLICAWGVGESVKAVMVITIIEVGALFYIFFSKGENLSRISDILLDLNPQSMDGFPLFGVASGAFLAFYAFIGFEDMVNMAEEVKQVKTNLPKAMIWAVLGTTSLYVLVAATMVTTVDPAELAEVNAPLAKIIEGDGHVVSRIFVIISMLTGINGALVQIIMSSRVLYGLGKEKRAPKLLAKVHPKTKTPIRSTVLATAIVLALSLFFPLVGLAEATSFLILVIFSVLNVALIIIKTRGDAVTKDSKIYPIWLPYVALVGCLGILSFKIMG